MPVANPPPNKGSVIALGSAGAQPLYQNGNGNPSDDCCSHVTASGRYFWANQRHLLYETAAECGSIFTINVAAFTLGQTLSGAGTALGVEEFTHSNSQKGRQASLLVWCLKVFFKMGYL